MLAINTDSLGLQNATDHTRYATSLLRRRADHAARRPPTVDEVGEMIRGTSLIGMACQALKQAGCMANITANRITIADDVVANLVTSPGAHTVWVISSGADRRAVCVVEAGERG
jgi:hypothetical protein